MTMYGLLRFMGYYGNKQLIFKYCEQCTWLSLLQTITISVVLLKVRGFKLKPGQKEQVVCANTHLKISKDLN